MISLFRQNLAKLPTSLRPSSIVRPFSSFDCGPPGKNHEDDIVHFENRKDIVIPEYPQRENEKLEVRKQRLIYQSRKRGMLENDLLLSTFASKFLKTMSAEQVQQYDTLINKPSNDWDIYYWATNKKPTPPEYETEVMTLLRDHVKNAQRESRRMPDL
ncbi:hypothetical protein HA402_011345 [Bradysia odoriphaga]|nr:hypothetical protein HA402_011345 [Bradysia odoriphaga]